MVLGKNSFSHCKVCHSIFHTEFELKILKKYYITKFESGCQPNEINVLWLVALYLKVLYDFDTTFQAYKCMIK